MAGAFARRAKHAAWIWAAWTAAGLFYISQDFVPRLYRNEPVPWRGLFVGWMAAMYICAAFTPAILWLGRRWPLEQHRRWAHAALHLGCGAMFSVLSAAIEVPVLVVLGVFPAVTPPASLAAGIQQMLAHGFHGGVIRYWAVIGLQAVVRSRQNALQLKARSAELAAELARAELSALKMQLQPHFLFNTLGAIMVLVQHGRRQEAETMLARLSDLLRVAVDDVRAQEVPLWRELEFLRLYLSIEEVRFRDRLQIRIEAEAGIQDALVPHMILQPIVENAIRHGLGQSEGPMSLNVLARQRQTDLVLSVADDGPGSHEPAFTRRGVGLTNTENRLRGLYGGKGMLVAENRVPRGVHVTVTLPFHTEPSPEGEYA